jgi:alpha,alpha-trehalase
VVSSPTVSAASAPIAILDAPAPPAPEAASPLIPGVKPETMRRLTAYIEKQWQNLRRNSTRPDALVDSKSVHPSPLYVPDLIKRSLPAGVVAQPLVVSAALLETPGLLYLPKDFVVPGGRFNEQYGWDSYFTVRGLLQDGQVGLAGDMVDNLLFEVEQYGKVLNANRSYYYGRSSPPFLGRAVLEVYHRTHDKEWLAKAVPLLEKEYASWRDTGPYGHQTANGLSRYASDIGRPCPEVEHGYYDNLPKDPDFYRNDRAERESGWDMTDRFGYRCMDYNPVDLNCLMVQSAKDIAAVHRELEGPQSAAVAKWEGEADHLASEIRSKMWDDEKGMFYDYDHVNGRRSDYASLATFMPLFTGVASPEQARRVRDNLKLFEHEGGLAVSARVSGKQWDAPYGWAPLQMIAVEGLRRYGFEGDARRVASRFLHCVAGVFEQRGQVLEKYDVVKMSGDAEVGYGNQEGFGWTNAVVRTFTEALRQPV